MLQKAKDKILFAGLVLNYIQAHYLKVLRRLLSSKIAALSAADPAHPPRSRNIVIVGAAFAGYHAVRQLATLLPPNSSFRIVVIEPNSHFNFTWVLPRFCTVEGHEHKAFIPYGPHLATAPTDAVHWIRDRVVSVGPKTLRLRDSPEEIPYEFLVIATGSMVPNGLPSRVGEEDKAAGTARLQAFQQRIKAATHIVVAGGGASGVELATDAKAAYPDKKVTLVHSRTAVMNRFGSGLQTAAMEALQRLGVEVILETKVASHGGDQGPVVLTSGKTLDCDCYINCTGQTPASAILADLAPGAISPSQHISIKPTLQIADDSLPNVYICGDVADTHISNPNSRAAMRQAETVADNILRALRGKSPRHIYKSQWGDGVIKLTLGLDRSVLHFWDGQKKQLLFPSEEKDLALMCDGAWLSLGAKPFDDPAESVKEPGIGEAVKITAAAEPGV